MVTAGFKWFSVHLNQIQSHWRQAQPPETNFVTLKTEAAHSSERLEQTYFSKRCNNPEGQNWRQLLFNIIYENDQQDATVWDNLLFLGCCACFERYFRSSSGASRLYCSFWYYIRISLPAGTSQQRHTCVIPEAVIQSRYTPDDEWKYLSKHVEQPRNNKLSYTVASCWSFSYIVSWCTETWILWMNIKSYLFFKIFRY